MNRSMAGWVVAAFLAGAWGERASTAHAASPPKVVCNAFYQDFPNGLVGTNRALEKANELGGQVGPWLEQQMAQGASAVQLHSFVPFQVGGGMAGGAELVCVSFPGA